MTWIPMLTHQADNSLNPQGADVHAIRRGRGHERGLTSLFFNAAHLPLPTEQYVAWVDVMGTQASMSTSLRTAASPGP